MNEKQANDAVWAAITAQRDFWESSPHWAAVAPDSTVYGVGCPKRSCFMLAYVNINESPRSRVTVHVYNDIARQKTQFQKVASFVRGNKTIEEILRAADVIVRLEMAK